MRDSFPGHHFVIVIAQNVWRIEEIDKTLIWNGLINIFNYSQLFDFLLSVCVCVVWCFRSACLCVLPVCMFICNVWSIWHRIFIFRMVVHLDHIWVIFVYQCHRVQVQVTHWKILILLPGHVLLAECFNQVKDMK